MASVVPDTMVTLAACVYCVVCVCVHVSGGFFDPHKDAETVGCQAWADEVRNSPGTLINVWAFSPTDYTKLFFP